MKKCWLYDIKKNKFDVNFICVILVLNVLNIFFIDIEKCMCWFFVFCCINFVVMLIVKVYFEMKEY